MRRKTLIKLSFVLASGLLGLLVLEIAVRIVHPQFLAVSQLADPVLLWRRRPNLDMQVLNADGEWFLFQTNSDGFRAREFNALPEGRQVLFFGDSFIEGDYVSDTCLFVNHVESFLREGTGDPYVCLNLGTAGYGLDQQTLLYNRLRGRLRPSVVVLAYAGGAVEKVATRTLFSLDPRGALISNVNESAAPPVSQRLYYGAKNFFLHDLHLFSAIIWPLSTNPDFIRLMTRLGLFHVDLAAIGESGPAFSYRHEQYRREAPPRIKTAWEKYSKVLALMDDRVRSDGARLMILYIPSEEEMYPDKWAKFSSEAAPGESPLDSGLVEQTVRRIAESRQIAFVSLLPVLRAAAREERLYYPKDGHWTCKTQRMAAREFSGMMIPHLRRMP
ncbi:MAG: hypothetical protein A3G34_06925 [Candidatus Lindowbacteria bacterium RIFCSPLOWO2_12_FULL_62_27]|nr:MAG: hypothetical protein A3G34_06925 [Candidatus Lindowbacteria bacterium RIFCSPLOWO2_12_FULL_62_27]OGH61277.1 MAG: hypothetical protein A3I06_03335 [Candidatus Lindowbacteria bacterium RIFCSPLOWO2_02_FULL_62_12]